MDSQASVPPVAALPPSLRSASPALDWTLDALTRGTPAGDVLASAPGELREQVQVALVDLEMLNAQLMEAEKPRFREFVDLAVQDPCWRQGACRRAFMRATDGCEDAGLLLAMLDLQDVARRSWLLLARRIRTAQVDRVRHIKLAPRTRAARSHAA